MTRARFVPFFAFVVGATFVPSLGAAQTITAAGQGFPMRLQADGKTDACGNSPPQSTCVGTRPANLTPLGVDYQDCISGQVLRFSVTLSGFGGDTNVGIYASTTSDCTAPTDRGGAGASAALCWIVAGGSSGLVQEAPATYTFDIPVTAIVGWQQNPPFPVPPSPPPLSPAVACSAQPSFAPVGINVDFVPLDQGNDAVGGALQYRLETDLAGPPPPRGLAVQADDEGLVPNWTPNTDGDTYGYDVFLAPSAGQPATQACPVIPGASDAGSTSGGISNVPAEYLVGENDGITAIGESTGAYAVPGLTDDATYAVAVAAVDHFGNVGPTSPPSCATPIVDGGTLDAATEGDASGVGGATDDSSRFTKAGCACVEGAPLAPAGAPAAASLVAIALALVRRRRATRATRTPARLPPLSG